MAESDFQIPDMVEAIVGWRAWSVNTDAKPIQLTSPAVEDGRIVWPPREAMIAKCPHGHDAPMADCHCGLYAARDQRHLIKQRYHQFDDGYPIVIGTVSLWGDVIPAAQGWRAQYAYPQNLLVPFSFAVVASRLKSEYGVTVILCNTLALDTENPETKDWWQ